MEDPSMQLVFEVYDGAGTEPLAGARKTFAGVGGVIGRGAGCDWVIPDASRLLSSHHGLVSYREGRYFLTDISSNGICVADSGERLNKGQARLIADGDLFQLGALAIRARLIEPPAPPGARRFTAPGAIPDDAFLALDPMQALDDEDLTHPSLDGLDALSTVAQEPGQWMTHSAADRDHLVLPRWVEPDLEVPPSPQVVTAPADNESFWTQFAAALGIRLDDVDRPAREALAIKVAGLLKLSIEGLQHNLRTCDELKNESNLAPAAPVVNSPNPLRQCADAETTLAALLGISEFGQLPADLAITQVHRDMQTHQIALLAACRAAARSAREAFAPSYLLLCFERQDKSPRFNTDGAQWRAYQRHYQRLVEAEPLTGHLLGKDFARAYDEQVRLISTLHVDYPG
jgi:type VI secretion system protein ImpI